MKTILSILLLTAFSFSVKSQSIQQVDSTKKLQTVEASCGKCNFGMKTEECSLAVRINGRAYEVEGASIDEFGDAHAKNGFCNAVRKANVQGEITNNKFVATYFKLLNPPLKKKTKKA